MLGGGACTPFRFPGTDVEEAAAAAVWFAACCCCCWCSASGSISTAVMARRRRLFRTTYKVGSGSLGVSMPADGSFVAHNREHALAASGRSANTSLSSLKGCRVSTASAAWCNRFTVDGCSSAVGTVMSADTRLSCTMCRNCST
eukprot:366228-Chlamydomonas_euryale.AAC.10